MVDIVSFFPEFIRNFALRNLFTTNRTFIDMETVPKVSIITIGRNNREGYARTIASVEAQTSRDYEWIVIDGASTDGSVDLLRAHEGSMARLVSEPDTGIFNAMNKGIALARGEYCNFMNSGDTFHAPDVLERVVPHLQGKDFYVGHQVSPNGRPAYWPAPREVRAYALVNKCMSHQSSFIRTALLKARPYREDFRILSDWEEMVYELLVRNASYERLDFVVSDFDKTGISSDRRYTELYQKEWLRVLHEHFPPRIVASLTESSKFQRKVRYALEKEKPLERDWKILRNALKILPKDLWASLKGTKKG